MIKLLESIDERIGKLTTEVEELRKIGAERKK